MREFRVERIDDDPSPDDGMRLLVDRLWPRGVSKEAAKIDLWAKNLTPSHELRKWFHDQPNQYAEFATVLVDIFAVYLPRRVTETAQAL